MEVIRTPNGISQKDSEILGKDKIRKTGVNRSQISVAFNIKQIIKEIKSERIFFIAHLKN